MQIEKGSIYILPLAQKITEHNLLIFDIGGQSARLHISQLSNNPTLNQRMFELFEVGQEVYVVV
jgi:ribosomal protein S1